MVWVAASCPDSRIYRKHINKSHLGFFFIRCPFVKYKGAFLTSQRVMPLTGGAAHLGDRTILALCLLSDLTTATSNLSNPAIGLSGLFYISLPVAGSGVLSPKKAMDDPSHDFSLDSTHWTGPVLLG
jgi:hypothetical protein